MNKSFEFFFDLASAWTCLAFHNGQPLAAEAGSTIIWRPFSGRWCSQPGQRGVCGVESPPPGQPEMVATGAVAARLGRAIGGADALSVEALCASIGARHALLLCPGGDRQNDLLQFAKACFDAHYTDQLNLDDPVVLVLVANSVDLDGEALRLRSQDPVIKDRLRSNTEEAVSRGAFGSPSVFVPFGAGERLYFGNDQLPLVAWAPRQEHA